MHRREFLIRSATGMGAAWLTSKSFWPLSPTKPLGKFALPTLSRLAVPGLRPAVSPWVPARSAPVITRTRPRSASEDSPIFCSTATINGLRFFDAADSYGSHPHVAEALKHVPRDKVTVLTKTWARDPATARADLDRFRRELGRRLSRHLPDALRHRADWTERFRGVMDVLSEAKQKGIIRAHGCSCHSIEALRAAAKSPWVESISPASIPSARTWTLIPRRWSVFARDESRRQSRGRDEDSGPGRSAQIGSRRRCAMRCRWECLTHLRSALRVS
jgi:hypothetical protein